MSSEDGRSIGILKGDVGAMNPQRRIEAAAVDFVAMAVIQDPRFHDPLERNALNGVLDSAESLTDLGEQIKGRFGAEALQVAIDRIAMDYGYLEKKPMNHPTDEAVRDAVVGWMVESYDPNVAQALNISAGLPQKTVIGVAEQIRVDTQKKLLGRIKVRGLTESDDAPKAIFRPSKSGKPRGPGSHTRGTRGKRN